MSRLKLAINKVRVRQAGHAEKWRDLSLVTKCHANVDDALVDLPFNEVARQLAKSQGVILTMSTYRVPLRENSADRGRMRARHLSD